MRKLLVAFLLLLPMMASAQRMTADKAKKAGVVVLLDQYVNAAGTKGNVIYLRLKDKSRPDKWKSGVYEVEVCIHTKVKTETLFPIAEPTMNSTEVIWTSLLDGQPYLKIQPENGGLEVTVDDQYGHRKYKMTSAVFYKTYIDALSKAPSLILGVENDPTNAMKYISEMFSVYK